MEGLEAVHPMKATLGLLLARSETSEQRSEICKADNYIAVPSFILSGAMTASSITIGGFCFSSVGASRVLIVDIPLLVSVPVVAFRRLRGNE